MIEYEHVPFAGYTLGFGYRSGDTVREREGKMLTNRWKHGQYALMPAITPHRNLTVDRQTHAYLSITLHYWADQDILAVISDTSPAIKNLY